MTGESEAKGEREPRETRALLRGIRAEREREDARRARTVALWKWFQGQLDARRTPRGE